VADADFFVLGVDLDGVCADFYGAMRPVVAYWLGVDKDSLTDDFTYGLLEWGVRDIKHYKSIHRYAVTQRRLFLDMEQVDGAGPALRRLSDDGVHVRVITHRLFIPHFHQEAVRQTVEWLDREGIPYWDLCFVKDKVEVGADLYVEDSPENIQALALMDKPVIVFSNPTNRNLEAPMRAESWDDVERIVREQVSLSGKMVAPPRSDEGPANEPS
jgi:5'(3')-deoxyribonucleotidase